MSNINTVAVSGNLTRDPEVRWLADDGASGIVNLGIAVNRSRKQGDEWVDEVSFFDIDVFGSYALTVARKLRKGDSATIQGRLEQESFEKDGAKRSVVKIIGERIDSEGFFRPKDEDAAVAVGSTPEPKQEELPTKAPQDDDIPF